VPYSRHEIENDIEYRTIVNGKDVDVLWVWIIVISWVSSIDISIIWKM
jgi:hypothetical protein